MKKRLTLIIILSLILTFISLGCQEKPAPKKERKQVKKEERKVEKEKVTPGVKITSFGHSMFLFEDSQGRRVVTDPYQEIGYGLPDVSANIVTVSHDHFDHNNVSLVKGEPEVVRKPGLTTANGISFEGISSFHDDVGGAKRGKNIIFKWQMDGLSIAHLGDFGQSSLTQEQLDKLRNIDILLIPVGGNYTIDAAKAKEFVAQLNPRIVIPMHYKRPELQIDIQPVDNFLREMVHLRLVANPRSVTISKLPKETEVWIMQHR